MPDQQPKPAPKPQPSVTDRVNTAERARVALQTSMDRRG
jgi:hypothetical protein